MVIRKDDNKEGLARKREKDVGVGVGRLGARRTTVPVIKAPWHRAEIGLSYCWTLRVQAGDQMMREAIAKSQCSTK